MKIFEWIFGSYFKPILVWLSTMTIFFLKDNAKTLSQFDLSILTTFFANNWKTIVGLLVLTLVLTFIIQRLIVLKKGNKRSNAPFFNFVVAISDHLLTDDYSIFNVKWSVRKINERVHVDDVPLCPNCKTELQEKITFWYRFKWTCINCGFSIKQKDSQSNIRNDVQTIVEGEMRRAEQINK